MDLLRHLRFFVALAEIRHYGDCAVRLGMTQPPLSQGIKRLEAHLGVRLFERGVRGVWLTPAGQALLPGAQRLLTDASVMQETARRVAEDVPLRIGLPADLGSRGALVVRAVTGSVGNVAPHVLPGVNLARRVADGSLDLAVVRHPAVIDGTNAGPVVRRPSFLLDDRVGGTRAQDEVDPTAPVPLSHVSLPVAVLPRWHHPPVHDQLEQTLQRHRHTAGVLVCPDLDTVRATVAAGRAVTLTRDPGDGPQVVGDPVPFRWRVLAPVRPKQRPGIRYDNLIELVGDAL